MRLRDREDFIGVALALCEDLDFATTEAAFLTDDDAPDLTCMTVQVGTDPDPEAVNEFFAGDHEYAAMVTRVAWAPNEDVDTGPAWMLAVVRRDQEAAFLIGRLDLQEWWQLLPEQAPWFALSTAGSLRGALNGHAMPAFKKAGEGDPRLFGAPGLGAPAPPEDEHGHI